MRNTTVCVRLVPLLLFTAILALFIPPAAHAADYQLMKEQGNVVSIEWRYTSPGNQLYLVLVNLVTFDQSPSGTTVTWNMTPSQWSKVSSGLISSWCTPQWSVGGSDCTAGSPNCTSYTNSKVECAYPDEYGGCAYIHGFVTRSASDGRYEFNGTRITEYPYQCNH